MLTPISFAIMPAKSGFAKPRRPVQKEHGGSPRIFAASIKTLYVLFAFVCPIYSERILGSERVFTFSVCIGFPGGNYVLFVTVSYCHMFSLVSLFIMSVYVFVVSITVQYTKAGF